ncbi:L-seryl-tRNA(Sec) selenium transferase [Acetivibrio ethanolgignens]|uniref:L-seryl-tRNA(Sec) selenium transferase n=1 Tax=Acetivibrio ethanolgignens TaxID=290052 RepID=A0A0V8QE57_9FIRM|nr:L-seryl-tRNA(Sec) selenium transferase [Acetivibrio ethanolgignens]KSV58893.1 L-seryl-tRNA(Sec) selenium transferase [Acetivibrio ethanolgignens]
MDKNLLYRSIPKVDVLLEEATMKEAIQLFGRELVIEATHMEMDELRRLIGDCEDEGEVRGLITNLAASITERIEKMLQPNMRRVINATGTILHTNLGRAPISQEHMKHIGEIATGYSNLEYNLREGHRGERYSHFEELLCKITGAEAAMAVNNNAAAVMLILSSLGKGGEVIVSRGELVEIGGKFRIPDVMAESGATLVEIGTTNKTHYSDYEEGITEQTRALLKVHTSNYRIVGFTESVAIDELIPLAEKHGIPVIEDLGSGVLLDLSQYGITYEPTVQDSIRAGADVVSFSGDKLLGGPQAGIIVGKKKYIDKMKKNQLTRALRIDKFTAAALEVVLQEYLSEEGAVKNIPVLQMITKALVEIEQEAEELKLFLETLELDAVIGIEACESQVGGGSLPLERIPSKAVTLRPGQISTAVLEERMRALPIPIISRTANDQVVMDIRTIGRENFEAFRQLKEYRVCS